MKTWSLILAASLLAISIAWWLAGPSAFLKSAHQKDAPGNSTVKKARLRPLPASIRNASVPRFKSEEPEPSSSAASSRLAKLLSGEGPDTSKLAGFLARHGRSPQSLLAAWAITKERSLVEEAHQKAPTDPEVLKALIPLLKPGEERKKAIEAYRLAKPDSIDAILLSAHDALKDGDPQGALDQLLDAEDLLAAPTLVNDTATAKNLVIEGWMATGLSPEGAKLMAFIAESKPMLTVYTQLGRSALEWMKAYSASGDREGTQQLAEMSIKLMRTLSGNALIDELVRTTIEKSALGQIPSDWVVPGSSLTAAERLAQIKEFSDELREVTPLLEPFLRSASNAQLREYSRRLESDGELSAARWLKSQR